MFYLQVTNTSVTEPTDNVFGTFQVISAVFWKPISYLISVFHISLFLIVFIQKLENVEYFKYLGSMTTNYK
jgi:hypothetical protein